MSHIEMLDRLEHGIAIDGIGSHAEELGRLADILVRTGTLPTVAGILADPTEPEVARLRAFARAASALRSRPSRADHALVA